MTAVESAVPAVNGDSGHIPYKTVDEVFKALPVQSARSLEVQLRDQAAQRRSDLQVLVGESYRDLLTTADTLIRMRDETLVLRTELSKWALSCDEEALARVVQNQRRFLTSTSPRRQKALKSWLRDVPSLIRALARQGDLTRASHLLVLAQGVAGTVQDAQQTFAESLERSQQLLATHIDALDSVTDFAVLHCQSQATTLQACLAYWLDLQPIRWSKCATLNDLADALLKTVDQLRQFARLADAFDEARTIVLSTSVASLPELDGRLLAEILPAELIKQQVRLPEVNLSQSEIQESFQTWLETHTAAIHVIIHNCLLAQKDIMAGVLQNAKQVRNQLDQANQDELYTQLVAPAITAYFDTVLDQSLVGFAAVKEALTHLVQGVPQDAAQTSLLGAEVPWQQRNLAVFRTITRRIVRGDLAIDRFSAFEARYVNVMGQVQEYLAVLSSNKSFQQGGYEARYRDKVAAVLEDLLKHLEMLSETVQRNKPALVQVARLVRYFSKTAPIPLSCHQLEANLASQLVTFLPEGLALLLGKEIVAADEAGLPTLPSAMCATSLVGWCRCLDTFGLDVVGPMMRAGARKKIATALLEALGDHEVPAEAPDEAALLLPHHRPIVAPSPLPESTTSGEVAGEHLTRQAIFDALFVSELLSLALGDRIAQEATKHKVDTKSLQSHVTEAVTKSRLFYKTLIA